MTYEQAYAMIPEEAEWSSSFGNPGEYGYSEYHRTKDGRRFVIDNGPWNAFKPLEWTVREL